MKFYLKQKIVTNPPPTDKIEKVSGVTEYEALRAEKLFRYEYSNQLNTSLLTFAFTVFTAGLIIFTLLFEFGGIFKPTENNVTGDQTYIVFAEYFFACFFLLPCFFSRINFRYTLKNSLRIGQLTDYTREKIQFDDGESWEIFKRDFRVNYFYKMPSGVGGAKDIPYWINGISCALSLSIGLIGMYNYITTVGNESEDLLKYVAIYSCIVIGMTIVAKILQPIVSINYRIGIFVILIIAFLSIPFISVNILKLIEIPDSMELIVVLIWFVLFVSCILMTPLYNQEIALANCVLEYTRVKLKYDRKKLKTKEPRICNKEMFDEFLLRSSVIKKFQENVKKKRIFRGRIIHKLWLMYYCKAILCQLNSGYDNPEEAVTRNYIHNKLRDVFLIRRSHEK